VILVDTSVWVEHFRRRNEILDVLLKQERIVAHPFIRGELALGHYSSARSALDEMAELQELRIADPDEVYHFIILHKLSGRGVGYVDVHLVASVRLYTGVQFWTFDKRLDRIAADLGVKASLTN
jgi:predicted nucleic acid-binding protein